jgi:hypothetical protein
VVVVVDAAGDRLQDLAEQELAEVPAGTAGEVPVALEQGDQPTLA